MIFCMQCPFVIALFSHSFAGSALQAREAAYTLLPVAGDSATDSATDRHAMTLIRQQGRTIIQTMLILLVVGLVGAYAADALLDYRCANDPARKFCVDRQPAQAPSMPSAQPG
jgi:hypothetical protein